MQSQHNFTKEYYSWLTLEMNVGSSPKRECSQLIQYCVVAAVFYFHQPYNILNVKYRYFDAQAIKILAFEDCYK